MKKLFLSLIVTTLLLPALLLSEQAIQLHTQSVSVVPTISSGVAYTAGDAVGGVEELVSAARNTQQSGVIHSVVLGDADQQDADLTVIWFTATPAGSTVTDNAAMDIVEADLAKVICVAKIVAADYQDYSATSSATKTALNCPFQLSSATSLYMAIIAVGTPTYTDTDSLKVTTTILQD